MESNNHDTSDFAEPDEPSASDARSALSQSDGVKVAMRKGQRFNWGIVLATAVSLMVWTSLPPQWQAETGVLLVALLCAASLWLRRRADMRSPRFDHNLSYVVPTMTMWIVLIEVNPQGVLQFVTWAAAALAISYAIIVVLTAAFDRVFG